MIPTIGEASRLIGRAALSPVELTRACLDRIADQNLVLNACWAKRRRFPDSIWADGILYDARNDTKMVRGGCLLDAALIGAARKLEQAEVVSYETAIEVAHTRQRPDVAALLERTHREERAKDARLHALLTAVLAI